MCPGLPHNVEAGFPGALSETASQAEAMLSLMIYQKPDSITFAAFFPPKQSQRTTL